jgi:hypothetical protein
LRKVHWASVMGCIYLMVAYEPPRTMLVLSETSVSALIDHAFTH